MVNNKGQMKIQQMAFMLIAVVIFFALVGMVVLTFSFSGLKESATLLEEQNAILLASKIANSPEFSCGNSFGTGKINCIDMDKVMMLKNRIQDYSGFWDVSNIEIRTTYPSNDEETLCTSSNYPDCNVLRLISDDVVGTSISNYVALCRKQDSSGGLYDKCELGKIIISYEEK